jgi:hypothetical protein
MKKAPRKVGRQIFVFTPEEKKVVACVLGALVLGLAVKYYRDIHPVMTPKLTPKQQYAAQHAAKAESARARSARGQREAVATVTPAPEVEEED